MGNSFNISVAPEIAAVQTVVDGNSVILTDIHDTDLPAIVTEIDANETKIDANKTVVDAIQAKTDIISLGFPGAITKYGLSTDSVAFIDLVNLTSSMGTIILISTGGDAAQSAEIKATIDSIIWTTLVHPAGADPGYLSPDLAPWSTVLSFEDSAVPVYMTIDFQDSCHIEVRSPGNVNIGFSAIIQLKS